MDPDSADAKFLMTRLRREENRIMDGLIEAIETADRLLDD